MANESYDERDHVIAEGTARTDASLALARRIQVELADSPAWAEATLGEPIVVRDLNTLPLFYDFEIRRNGEVSGYLRMAANELIGTPDVSLEVGARPWNLQQQLQVWTSEHPDAPSAPLLVCYGYPKLGFMVKTPVGQKSIYDAVSLQRVEQSDDDAYEGAFAWSFFDSLTPGDRKDRLSRYQLYQSISLDPSARLTGVARKTLQFCSHCDSDEPRAHACFSLHGQQVDDYCAVATCQMILSYYGYDLAQDEIAPALHYKAGHGCPKDQSPGYPALTSGNLVAKFEGAPTWEMGRDEIDALRPFKSGIPRHARAGIGYGTNDWVTATAAVTEQLLCLGDPSPSNPDPKIGGHILWEKWDAIQHTDYVTVKIGP